MFARGTDVVGAARVVVASFVYDLKLSTSTV